MLLRNNISYNKRDMKYPEFRLSFTLDIQQNYDNCNIRAIYFSITA